MWQYGRTKLHEIGLRGVLAGWGLSFAKDSVGYAAFFATFEYVKAQAYFAFISSYYGDHWSQALPFMLKPELDGSGAIDIIKPYVFLNSLLKCLGHLLVGRTFEDAS